MSSQYETLLDNWRQTALLSGASTGERVTSDLVCSVGVGLRLCRELNVNSVNRQARFGSGLDRIGSTARNDLRAGE